MCDHYPILRKSVSLDDFGDFETNFLDRIEEDFENQLDDYVELIDVAYFDFQICFYVACCQFDFNGFSFYVCLRIKNEIYPYPMGK